MPSRRAAKFGVKPLTKVEKVLNVSICVISGIAAGLAVVELYSQGFPVIGRDVVAALRTGTPFSGIGLTALFLQPLFYQMVDITNWQRIAAFEKDRYPNDAGQGGRAAAFWRFWQLYAAEAPLMWLFLCMFGALAAISTAAPGGAGALANFVGQMAAQDNFVAATALALLVVAVLAMALLTMSSLFSASLAAIRYDLLPAIWPEGAAAAPAMLAAATAAMAPTAATADTATAAEKAPEEAAAQARARLRTIVAGAGLCLLIVAAFHVADDNLRITTGNSFLALLFAFSCIQLAFAPLVLGPLVGRPSGGYGTVSADWALVILGASAAVGVAAIVLYAMTGYEPWLWTAVPACLGTGALLFAAARIWPGKAAQAA